MMGIAVSSVSGGSSSLPSSRQLFFGLVLMVTMFVGTFPQYALGVLAPLLLDEIDIGEIELGLVASVLYVAAAVVARFGGRQLDRMQGRSALLLLFITSTGSLILISLSRSMLWLFGAVLISGIAIGANNPVTNRLIALHVPAGRRGYVIGIKQVGVKVANVAAGVLIPLFALTLGWRPGLRTFALVGLILGLAILKVVPAGSTEPTSSRPRGTPADLRGRVRWLRYYAAFMAIGMSSITTYLPLHAVQNADMSLTQAGGVVTIMGSVAVGARLVWAALADRTGKPATLMIVLAGVGSVALLMVASAGTLGAWILWIGAAVVGATVGSWNVVAHLTIVQEVDAAQTASATGLLQATFLVCLAIGAPVFGALVDVTGSFVSGWILTAGLSVVAAMTAAYEQRRRGVRIETAPNIDL